MVDRSEDLIRLRRAGSSAKAARVVAALDAMVAAGEPPQIAVLARQAGVSRRFIYDHPELRAEAEQRAAQAADRYVSASVASARVTTASLRADLENSKARNHRLEADVTVLRRRLGELLGAEVLADEVGAGLVSADRTTNIRLAELDQALFDAHEALARRSEELEAARQINRELMARINRG